MNRILFISAAALGAAARVKTAHHRCQQGGGAGKRPLPSLDIEEESSTPDHAPYLRFYAGHQRDMEFRVRNLQDRARIALSGLSPRLARLVALESALDQTLVAQHRQCFAQVPRLLERRFEFLAGKGEMGEALLPAYQRDMRSLLLAEVDARLLPVLGLIEAIDEEPVTQQQTWNSNAS